jgi:hypothetical protein
MGRLTRGIVTARAIPAAIHSSRVGGVVGVGRARAHAACAIALQLGLGGGGDGHCSWVMSSFLVVESWFDFLGAGLRRWSCVWK